MDQEKYIEKWLNGTLTEQEFEEFKQMAAYNDLKKLDSNLQKFKAPGFDTNTEYARLQNRLHSEAKVIKVNWLSRAMKIAAAILLLVVSYYAIILGTQESIVTGSGEHLTLFLPDSSRVTVNASSELSYQSFNWDDNRSVKLDGEAYFKVKKGSSFDVKTPIGTVTVLGTRFNVTSRTNYFEVTCYEGKVQVLSSANTVVLTAGKKFTIIDQETQPHSEEAPSWIENRSNFTSMPYGYVIDEFERQYGIEVELVDVDTSILFTGGFVHNDMDQALQAICLPLGLKYKKTEYNILLTRENN